MRIGFVVNDVAKESAGYSTTRLSMQAAAMGHEAYTMGTGDFTWEADGAISARAHKAPDKNYRSQERYFDDLCKESSVEQVVASQLDVVMLRADPAEDAHAAAWANTAEVSFGQLLAATGTLVVNDPNSLANALSKAYFQGFPELVRPNTLISRDHDKIVEFVEANRGRAVLKPLQGSGGSGVFLVNSKESPNLNQIIEATLRDGYVVAQEYLPEATEGDVRMFIMNGSPLVVNGKHAAFRRRSSGSDMRSNVSAGGKVVAVEVTDEMLALAEAVKPKLVADGMFLVGLDIVGDKLMEVNVFSPGGLGISQTLYGENFAQAIIEDLERKVATQGDYGHTLTNAQLASS